MFEGIRAPFSHPCAIAFVGHWHIGVLTQTLLCYYNPLPKTITNPKKNCIEVPDQGFKYEVTAQSRRWSFLAEPNALHGSRIP